MNFSSLKPDGKAFADRGAPFLQSFPVDFCLIHLLFATYSIVLLFQTERFGMW